MSFPNDIEMKDEDDIYAHFIAEQIGFDGDTNEALTLDQALKVATAICNSNLIGKATTVIDSDYDNTDGISSRFLTTTLEGIKKIGRAHV